MYIINIYIYYMYYICMLLSKMLVREEISSQLPTSERPRRCSSETLEDKNLFDEMYHLKVTKTREIS